MNESAECYGLLAEFAGPEELVEAARQVTAAGYRHVDAYSPLPVEGLAEALGFRRTKVPVVILAGGVLGGLAGYALQFWISVVAYPLNVGGRPLNSWPSFIPVTFEMTILCASIAGVLGMLALNGLPRPHHPLFGVAEFSRASRDGFFLCVEATDPRFSLDETQQLLRRTHAIEVLHVPA